jgi:hypothetical protein
MCELLTNVNKKEIALDLQDIKSLNELAGHLMLLTLDGHIEVEIYIAFINDLISRYKQNN